MSDTTKLNLDTLKSWLWDSANILRGSIDSSDFKNYIFGLLFLKRMNDTFDEETDKNLEEDPDQTREEAQEDVFYQVPENARWDFLKTQTENIGMKLDKAFASIEEHNKALKLEGVMTATKFGDKAVLSDETLQRLLRHFNKYSLKNKDLESNDLLGDAYEYLIKQFADDAGKKGGEFYTPRGVVQLIVRLIKPQEGHKVYDPTCGSGGMLIESARYIREHFGAVGENINVSLYGQEKNLSTWAICKLNMILHNHSDADIRKGDTLNDPKHKNSDTELQVFDRICANPPFSMGKWWQKSETNIETKLDKNGKEKEIAPKYDLKNIADSYGRFRFGVPPRGYADLAFLQHMIASLKNDAIAGIVLPHGTLFRGGAEGKIRKQILDNDLLEGIVGLPSALFYNTGIPASVWILNKQKKHKNKVFIIDASQEYKEGKNQNQILTPHIDKVIDAYEKEQDIDKFMRVVDMTEIIENDYNLNISRYIDTSEPEEIIDLNAVKNNIAQLQNEQQNIDEKLNHFLNELGI